LRYIPATAYPGAPFCRKGHGGAPPPHCPPVGLRRSAALNAFRFTDWIFHLRSTSTLRHGWGGKKTLLYSSAQKLPLLNNVF
jgi:hypothetical protein